MVSDMCNGLWATESKLFVFVHPTLLNKFQHIREATLQCGPVFRNGPLLVHDSVLGSGTVGIPRDMLSTTVHWTAYYRGHARNPDNVKDLAPWVIKRLEQFSGFVYTSKKRAAVN